MADMSRRTVSLPENMEAALIELRKTDRFCRCSYSEIVRQLIEAGLNEVEKTSCEKKASAAS